MNYIKFLRVTNDLKQIDVREATGIGRNRYINLERDDSLLTGNLTYDELEKLAKFYNMTVDKLIYMYRNKEKIKVIN
ncbi:helix-turn-helix domain-containing protein [Staphylococcus pasteuri]|uniref:helix-turn-helix domain-containing protein n=1 Tax=Staphylococcus pasteuri TaxID=45972 RepID=UPI001E291966|nr:helix-turn-helix transcriptional regulator [Staphylococcus pasteuri]MCE3023124.1 helix-turn-helix domain-containing protein [Staphylococcus pasteuri]